MLLIKIEFFFCLYKWVSNFVNVFLFELFDFIMVINLLVGSFKLIDLSNKGEEGL